jgi:hypothetical protein
VAPWQPSYSRSTWWCEQMSWRPLWRCHAPQGSIWCIPMRPSALQYDDTCAGMRFVSPSSVEQRTPAHKDITSSSENSASVCSFISHPWVYNYIIYYCLQLPLNSVCFTHQIPSPFSCLNSLS